MMRPALLVDVDGVLNALLRCNKPRATCPCHPGWRHVWARPFGDISYRLSLNPAHGPALLELAAATHAELVWATTWQEHANTWVGPKVGAHRVITVDERTGLTDEHFAAARGWLSGLAL
jgi:hypothetical protein